MENFEFTFFPLNNNIALLEVQSIKIDLLLLSLRLNSCLIGVSKTMHFDISSMSVHASSGAATIIKRDKL